MKTYHFISGLPRSGSTLLSSILRQNPRFHTSITDPLCSFTGGIIETLASEPGMKAEVPQSRREATIKGMFEGFYSHIDRPVVFNTNRAWTKFTPQVKHLFPSAKIIVCVRDINKVLDSFESIHRKYPLNTNTIFGGFGRSVYERIDLLMTENGVVGMPYLAIKQAICSDEKNILMLVEYDELCKNTESTMRALYSFIGEPYYNHDFDNVEASWDEYDLEIGIPLHRVRKKVQAIHRDYILPPDILNKYINMEVWRL
jgi:sulfotransferase